MNQLLKDIGNRIREARIANGYEQEYLAELVDITPVYMSRIENGKANFSVEIMVKLLDALHISLEWLLNRDIEDISDNKKIFDEIFSDCTEAEATALLNTLRAMKSNIRSIK